MADQRDYAEVTFVKMYDQLSLAQEYWPNTEWRWVVSPHVWSDLVRYSRNIGTPYPGDSRHSGMVWGVPVQVDSRQDYFELEAFNEM